MVWQIVLLALGVAAGAAWLWDRKMIHKLRNKELDISARKVEVESKRVQAETLPPRLRRSRPKPLSEPKSVVLRPSGRRTTPNPDSTLRRARPVTSFTGRARRFNPYTAGYFYAIITSVISMLGGRIRPLLPQKGSCSWLKKPNYSKKQPN